MCVKVTHFKLIQIYFLCRHLSFLSPLLVQIVLPVHFFMKFGRQSNLLLLTDLSALLLPSPPPHKKKSASLDDGLFRLMGSASPL